MSETAMFTVYVFTSYGSDVSFESKRTFASNEVASAYQDGLHTGAGMFAGDDLKTFRLPGEEGELDEWLVADGWGDEAKAARVKAFAEAKGASPTR